MINEELLTLIEEICTTVAGMMGTEPITLAGQEHPSKYKKQVKKTERLGDKRYKRYKLRQRKKSKNKH